MLMLCDGSWDNLYSALEYVGKPALMRPIPDDQGVGKRPCMWLYWMWLRPQRRRGTGYGGDTPDGKTDNGWIGGKFDAIVVFGGTYGSHT